MLNKFNFYKNLKFFLISFATIFLAGILVLCFCGFNLGVDLKGGTSFSIAPENASIMADETFNKEFVDNKNEIVSSVKSVLKDNGVELDKVQFVGEENAMTISFTVKNKSSIHKDDLASFNEKLKTQISDEIAKISDEITLEVSSLNVISPSTSLNVLLEISALCLILVLIFAYIAIRFFPLGAITTIFGVLIDSALFIAVCALARIEITKFISCGVLVCVIVQTIFQTIILSKVKESYQNKELGDKTNKEIATSAISSSFPICLILTTVLFAFALVLMFLNLELGLYIAVATIISAVSSIFISPVLFGIIASKKGLNPTFNKLNK